MGHRPFWAHGLPVDEQAALIRYWGHHRPLSRSDLAEVMGAEPKRTSPTVDPMRHMFETGLGLATNDVRAEKAMQAEVLSWLNGAS